MAVMQYPVDKPAGHGHGKQQDQNPNKNHFAQGGFCDQVI